MSEGPTTDPKPESENAWMPVTQRNKTMHAHHTPTKHSDSRERSTSVAAAAAAFFFKSWCSCGGVPSATLLLFELVFLPVELSFVPFRFVSFGFGCPSNESIRPSARFAIHSFDSSVQTGINRAVFRGDDHNTWCGPRCGRTVFFLVRGIASAIVPTASAFL